MSRKRFALFGRSVRASPSPTMFQAAMSAMGLSHGYMAVDVPSEGSLRRMIEEIRRKALDGANITAPYKRKVLDFVDGATPVAEELGAANVISRADNGVIVADNTDVEAIEGILRRRCEHKSRAAIIGAGGAAMAAALACRRVGFSVVAVTTRSWLDSDVAFESEPAERLRALGALTSPWPSLRVVLPRGKASTVLRLQWSEMAYQADVVIQATSAGAMGGDSGEEVASIVPWAKLPDHAFALDLVYGKSDTPFVREARVRKLATEDGLAMLVRQGELSFNRWLGVDPPPGVMLAAASRALERQELGST